MSTSLFLKKNALILISLTLFLGCSGVNSVPFETPVDTQDRPIQNQLKKKYEISDIDVYASNNFPGARLNGIEKLNDSTIKVLIHPENKPINPSPYYAFKLWSTNPQDIYVAFEYPEKVKHRYHPKIQDETEKWKQIDTNQFYRIDSLFAVKVSLDQKPKILAAQELANSKDVKEWYTDLGKMKNFIHIKKYGTSKLGRDLNLLDIYRGERKSKPILVLLTRQHPPEITGYLAYQSFLETILKENEITERFLNEYRVLAFPLLNPDGVDLGHWRHNAGGVDLNRDWSKYNQPEVRKTVEYIDKQVKKYNTTVDLAIDFHSTYEDVFYTNKQRKGTQLPNFIKNWFDALEKEIPEYVVNEAAGNSKKPVSKGFFLKKYNSVGITYEIGDQTPRDRIDEIGRISAEEMMKLLTD